MVFFSVQMFSQILSYSKRNKMNELLKKLDESIVMVLEECDTLDMPNLCAIRNTPEGVKSIIKLARKRILLQKLTIYEALQSIENEFTES